MCLRTILFRLLGARARLERSPAPSTADDPAAEPAEVTAYAATDPPPPAPTPPEDEIQARISHRAYEIYLARGAQDGDANADWSRAEREVRSEVARGV